MNVTVISTIDGALGTLLKSLEKKLVELEFRKNPYYTNFTNVKMS